MLERLYAVTVRHAPNETVPCHGGAYASPPACQNGGACAAAGGSRPVCECLAGTAGAECERVLGDAGGEDGLYARAWFDAGHGVTYDSAAELCRTAGFTGLLRRPGFAFYFRACSLQC